MKKSKSRIDVENMIYKGHRLGMCDTEGNSVSTSAGPVAKPRSISGIKIRYCNGYKEIWTRKGWCKCES